MKKVVERRYNKTYYRVLHVPLWILVFWILPGQLTEDLFSHGPDCRHWVWLIFLTLLCAWRGYAGSLPGCEPQPYITHFGEDKPNLLFRVVCYTAAWVDLLAPFTINLTALMMASLTGKWLIYSLYAQLYYLVVVAIAMATVLNWTPRAKRSIRGEETEKAWFYAAVWTVVPTEIAAWAMWRLGRSFGLSGASLDHARLATFLVVSATFLTLGLLGRLPRTARFQLVDELPDAASSNPPASDTLEPLKI
jgi:hypothetical protein